MGSQLSTTGELLVRCNAPYVLEVDGVEWSPITSDADGDKFVISSGGSFVILVEGMRVFYFRNTITEDFSYINAIVRFSSGGRDVANVTSSGGYVQTEMIEGEFDTIRVACVGTSIPATSIVDLELSVNQGNIEVGSLSDNIVRVNITNVDPSQYLQVNFGNVLVAFITPRE